MLVATSSLLDNSVYENVISPDMLPATLAQDMVALVLGFLTLILIKDPTPRKQVIVLGVHGFYFYAYGIYVIERLYNHLYLSYMAIFSLSFFISIVTVTRLWENPRTIILPKWLRQSSAGYMLLNAAIFYPLWVSQLLPLMQTNTKIEYFYSVYIIDLCFIMPMFILCAFLCIKENSFGVLVTPALLIVGATILLPLALGEVIKNLFYHLPMDFGSIGIFGTISAGFILLMVLHFKNLGIE